MIKKLAYSLTVMLIAANLNAGIFNRKSVQPHCGIKVVAYKFIGNPGTKLVYATSSFVIPASGVIELIAHKDHTTFQVAGRSFDIRSSATDEFGTATVELYRAATRL